MRGRRCLRGSAGRSLGISTRTRTGRVLAASGRTEHCPGCHQSNWGDVAFDPAAPIDQATARINTTALAFTRAPTVAGRSTNIGIVVPIIAGHVEGLYFGAPAEVGRFGQGDPRFRLAMNLYGAPAM